MIRRTCELDTLVDERFGPEYRVKRRKDFLRIQNGGRKLRSPHLLLSYNKLPVEENCRIIKVGITITTKVHKRAVRRNLLRRRIRELFRKKKRRFDCPAEMVVIALRGSTELSFRDLDREFHGLLLKAGLIKRGKKRLRPKR